MPLREIAYGPHTCGHWRTGGRKHLDIVQCTECGRHWYLTCGQWSPVRWYHWRLRRTIRAVGGDR